MLRTDLLRAARTQCEALVGLVAELDPDEVPLSQATAVYAELDRIVRVASAARVLVARRVDEAQEWKRRGHRTAAEALAAASGSSLGAARDELAASNALSGLPATRDRMLEGKLSANQATVIADAAAANPGAEAALLDAAGTANLH